MASSSSNPTASIPTATSAPPASTVATTTAAPALEVARREQLRFYRRAPIFGEDDHFARACKTVSFESKFDALLLGDEDEEASKWGFLPPEGTLRFRLERGDFQWSHIDFEAPGGSPAHFAAWNSYMWSSYSEILAKVGLERAKWFGEFTLSKNNAALPILISRWNVTTHTFIAAWGEFTITLEDVCELLGLEAAGHEPYIDEALDAQETSDVWSWTGYAEGALDRQTKPLSPHSSIISSRSLLQVVLQHQRMPLGKVPRWNFLLTYL